MAVYRKAFTARGHVSENLMGYTASQLVASIMIGSTARLLQVIVPSQSQHKDQLNSLETSV
jgi:hypothetical protein